MSPRPTWPTLRVASRDFWTGSPGGHLDMRTDPADWRPRDIEDLEPAAWDALRAGTLSVTAGPGAGKSEFLAQRASSFSRPACAVLPVRSSRSRSSGTRQPISGDVCGHGCPEHAERFTSMTFDWFTKSIVDRFKDLLPPAWAITGTYRIGFASQDEVRDFLGNLAAAAPEKFRSALYGIRQAGFIANFVGSYRLEPEPQEPVTAKDYAIQRGGLANTRPTMFPRRLRHAEPTGRAGHPFKPAAAARTRRDLPVRVRRRVPGHDLRPVSFLESVFARERTTVTVVGDRKQRIMGWAGALADAFARFEHDFDAQPFELTWNFRSTQELVKLMTSRFATRLDPDSHQQLSQVVSQVGDPNPGLVVLQRQARG